MTTVKDQAICIGRRNYSESSQIVTFFARNCGKISAIAKGSRRQRSGFGGGIDLLSIGQIIFTHPRHQSTLATLTQFALSQPLPCLRKNLLALHCGQYMAGMVADFTEDFDPHEELYDIFASSLNQLQSAERPEAVLVSFELALLCQVGLEPTWNRCCNCQANLNQTRQVFFSSSLGGTICRDCEPAVVEKRLIEPAVLHLLEHPKSISSANAPVIIQTHKLLSYHQQEILGKRTAIMKFVDQLLQKNKR